MRRVDYRDEIRLALAARRNRCWVRLDDAVLELMELHDVPRAQIRAHVREAIERDRPAPEAGAAPTPHHPSAG